MSVDHSKRLAAEDNRNEAARVQKLAAHEAEVRRLLHDRWWRRMQALMPTETPVIVQDFGTECTL